MKKNLTKFISLILVVVFAFNLTSCQFLYSLFPELCPHSWKFLQTESAPTCTVVGYDVYECEYCLEQKLEVKPKLSHDLRDSLTEEGVKVCFNCSYRCALPSGEISFHFPLLGNEYAGDCIYIKAGEYDVLIDAGSRAGSVEYISEYIDQYVTDGILEFVIVTHADQDHIAGFAKAKNGIFDLYECKTIIDFPRTSKTTETYNRYVTNRNKEINQGATHYTALECYNNANGAQRFYDLSGDGNVKMEILYNYYYEHSSSDENNYSVCLQFHHGDRKFIFTGDLEKEGEEYLIQYNELSQVELYKAGHHGSKTSSTTNLLEKIQPKMCVVCCCAGSFEYKAKPENTFPTQDFINRISPYTDKVFVPIMINFIQTEGVNTATKDDDVYKNDGEYQLLNGNITVTSDAAKGVYVVCSNNETLLKDTNWFKANRTTPLSWA